MRQCGSSAWVKTYAVSSRTSRQPDVQLTACHLCLKREATWEPWEAGTAAAGPGGSGLPVGASFGLCGLGRALAGLTAQRSHQAYSQRRRPLGGGWGVGRRGLLWWDGEEMIRIRRCSQRGAALLENGKTWVILSALHQHVRVQLQRLGCTNKLYQPDQRQAQILPLR